MNLAHAGQLRERRNGVGEIYLFLGPEAVGSSTVNETFSDEADTFAPFTLQITDANDGSGNFSFVSS